MTPRLPDHPLAPFYRIGIMAIACGILVTFLLNMATPLEFILERFRELTADDSTPWAALAAGRLLIFFGLAGLSSTPFMLILHRYLAPVAACLAMRHRSGPANQPSPALLTSARQRVINLPFFIVPVTLAMWSVIPGLVFTLAVIMDRMGAGPALMFFLRSVMVGCISAGILFFGMEAEARKYLIPWLFPGGELHRVAGARRLSLYRRIRAFFRVGSLIPLTNIVMTLFILYRQVETDTVTAKTYGLGVLIFSVVVFVLFFISGGFGSRLFARSISDPLTDMIQTLSHVKAGRYDTRVTVVSNDEIGTLGDAFNQMIQGLQEKEKLQEVFGRYVTPQIRDEIMSGRISLEGAYTDVTVMFADLKDYTPMTETRDPRQVVQLLNAYFKEMDTVITAHDGLILQFLGDEIYAVFGAPIACPAHPEQACRAAVMMNQRLTALNRSLQDQGLPSLSHGIGIHSGRAVAAGIGSPDRQSYLLVGDTINLASRLQSMTRPLKARIILSQDTVSRLPEQLCRHAGLSAPRSVPVKGRQGHVTIYTVC